MTVYSPMSGKVNARGAFMGLSMIQAARAAMNQQLNSMLSPRITTSTQEMPRSSNAAFRGVMALNFGQHRCQHKETTPSRLLIVDLKNQ